jgi:hypothetical protein
MLRDRFYAQTIKYLGTLKFYTINSHNNPRATTTLDSFSLTSKTLSMLQRQQSQDAWTFVMQTAALTRNLETVSSFLYTNGLKN